MTVCKWLILALLVLLVKSWHPSRYSTAYPAASTPCSMQNLTRCILSPCNNDTFFRIVGRHRNFWWLLAGDSHLRLIFHVLLKSILRVSSPLLNFERKWWHNDHLVCCRANAHTCIIGRRGYEFNETLEDRVHAYFEEGWNLCVTWKWLPVIDDEELRWLSFIRKFPTAPNHLLLNFGLHILARKQTRKHWYPAFVKMFQTLRLLYKTTEVKSVFHVVSAILPSQNASKDSFVNIPEIRLRNEQLMVDQRFLLSQLDFPLGWVDASLLSKAYPNLIGSDGVHYRGDYSQYMLQADLTSMDLDRLYIQERPPQ